MFKQFSMNFFHQLLSRFLWFILIFNGVAPHTEVTNNTSSGTPYGTSTTPVNGLTITTIVSIAVGAFVIVGALFLVICVATFYAKRMKNETGDYELGQRGHNSANSYESLALDSEENAPQNQVATADDHTEEEDEEEDISDVEDGGHYTRVEIGSGNSKSAAKCTADAEKSNASALQSSSDAEVLYTKKKVKVKVNGSNPLYSQVAKKGTAKAQSVEDLYTKVRGKKNRKGSSTTCGEDDLYTKSSKQKGKGSSYATTGSVDDIYTKAQKRHKHGDTSSAKETSEDLYTKSQKEQKGQNQAEQGHGTAASTSGSVDDLYTKPRKKRVAKGTTKDLDEMYTKSQKKKKVKVRKVPFYINSDKVDAEQKARESTPTTTNGGEMYEDEKNLANNGAKGGIVQDNELYTDCPN